MLAEQGKKEKKTAPNGKSAQRERAHRGERTQTQKSAGPGAAQASPSERG